MKFRHESPHAEQQIRERGLRGWQTAAELEAERRAAERKARRAAELATVDWSALSPHELAFRWLLSHYRSDVPTDYSRWAHEVRAEWNARRKPAGSQRG